MKKLEIQVIFMIMLNRSSEKIPNPMRYTGDNIYSIVFKMFQLNRICCCIISCHMMVE